MCKTIKQKIKFKANPKTIFNLLTNPKDLQALTGKKARIKKEIGSSFSINGGAITGIMVDFSPQKRIVQAWRDKRFPPGIFSMASITLAPTWRRGTELILTHRGVPKDLIPSIESQWRSNFWEKIKKLTIES